MSRPRKAHRLAFVLALCGVGPLSACTVGGIDPVGPGPGADATAIDCQFSESASVTVGGGTEQAGFVEMTDGGEMTMVLGPQGLYMVTPSIRASGFYPGTAGRAGHPDDPQILIEIFLSGSLVGGSAEEHLGLTQTTAGDERLGIFTPFTGDVGQYVEQMVTLRASVSDACGSSSSDELSIVVRQ